MRAGVDDTLLFFIYFTLLFIIIKLQRPGSHSVSKHLVAAATVQHFLQYIHLRTGHNSEWILAAAAHFLTFDVLK